MTTQGEGGQTMLERVARAIEPDAFKARLPGHEVGKCVDCDYELETALAKARAAVEAMREPTLEMEKAGDKTDWDCIDMSPDPLEGVDKFTARPAWEAMIEAALSEEGKKG